MPQVGNDKYRNGAVEKTKAESRSILFRPQRSESNPAGMLATMPVKADMAATSPTPAGSAPRWEAKRGRTGLLEIVELKMASPPVKHRSKNGDKLSFIFSQFKSQWEQNVS